MYHDILPHKYSPDYKPRDPKNGDIVLVYGKGTVMVCKEQLEQGQAPSLPHYPKVKAFYGDFLFNIDDVAFYGYRSENITDGCEMVTIRDLFKLKPSVISYAAATGYHIVSWKNYHRFCGVCGTELRPSETERALVCPKCGHTIYPDIHPAVNIAIRNGDKLLMARRSFDPNVNYALVAGFIEIGETAEDTVRREPMEEVGLKVKNIHYFGSQPWGIVQNLQIGFYCDVDGSDEIHVDGVEIKDAKWFDRSELPTALGSHSITGAMIEAFRRGEI